MKRRMSHLNRMLALLLALLLTLPLALAEGIVGERVDIAVEEMGEVALEGEVALPTGQEEGGAFVASNVDPDTDYSLTSANNYVCIYVNNLESLVESAKVGDKVYLSLNDEEDLPEKKYFTGDYVLTDGSGETVVVDFSKETIDYREYTYFIMPAQNVTVEELRSCFEVLGKKRKINDG